MATESMEPFESSENLDEDVGMFEAATHCPVVELPIPEIRTIVLALDGSNQDSTTRGYAEQVAARTGAKIETLTGPGKAAEILQAIERHHADLLVVDVPYGQDFDELGCDSLGSVVDVLLVKSKIPVLCVRAVQEEASIQAGLNSVIVPIAIADEQVARALGWAFGLSGKDGRIDIVAVADGDVLSEAGHYAKGLAKLPPDASQLSRALLTEIGGVVAAAQKRGHDEGRTVHVETRVGKFVPLTLAELHGRPHVIIWGITRDHSSPAFHRAVDLLLASTGPVLMV